MASYCSGTHLLLESRRYPRLEQTPGFTAFPGRRGGRPLHTLLGARAKPGANPAQNRPKSGIAVMAMPPSRITA